MKNISSSVKRFLVVGNPRIFREIVNEVGVKERVAISTLYSLLNKYVKVEREGRRVVVYRAGGRVYVEEIDGEKFVVYGDKYIEEIGNVVEYLFENKERIEASNVEEIIRYLIGNNCLDIVECLRDVAIVVKSSRKILTLYERGEELSELISGFVSLYNRYHIFLKELYVKVPDFGFVKYGYYDIDKDLEMRGIGEKEIRYFPDEVKWYVLVFESLIEEVGYVIFEIGIKRKDRKFMYYTVIERPGFYENLILEELNKLTQMYSISE